MKKHFVTVFGATLFLLGDSAFALTVTNLDTVPHTVLYEAAGSRHEARIAPNRMVRFDGVADGKLSLESDDPKPSNGNLHADGLLSGIVGAERDQDIPTDDQDEYAIWPGGELQLQHRTRDYQRN